MIAKVHVIVPTKWHNNPSTQKQPSAYSSTQRQSSAYPSAQRQSSVYPLAEVCNVLYGKSQGLGCQAGASEDHPPHGGSDGIHVYHPCGLILHNVTGTHCGYSWFNFHFQSQGSGGTFKAVARDLSLHRQVITSWKPGGGATSCIISRGSVSDMDSCLVSSTC